MSWQMQGAMESCPVKTAISGGMGFALGGAFGLFMSSVNSSGGMLLYQGGLADCRCR